MATSDIQPDLNTDLFRVNDLPQAELLRRLQLFVEQLQTKLKQIEGSLLENSNVVTYGNSNVETGRTVVRVGFDVDGNTVNLEFVDGKLVL